MAYEVVMPYHLHMPSYFLETFTEYPERTLPLRTKRQHYPRFDTPLSIDRFSFGIPLLFIVCFVFTA